VYVDSNVIAGNTDEAVESGQYKGLIYLKSSLERDFQPELPTQKVDLIYLCFPNNPTGAVATRDYLQTWVNWALENQAVIIYDAAYSWFIKDQDIPKSIYEIPGSKECAIEIQSFSKFAGFTGVRLGWTVVPFELKTSDSKEKQLNQMWTRRQNTFFNGASNLAQAAGVAALSQQGQKENQLVIDFYMENAKLLKDCIQGLGLKVLGGHNAPYIWLETPTIEGKKLTSWEFFDYLLNQIQVVSTPGSGFGPGGEGWIRLSSFGLRENVLEGIKRLNSLKAKFN
jgi:LL-diaminopimelate aminotransferase